MKKHHLFFSSLLLVTFLFTSNHARAQKDTTTWMVMLEYRVHDESIFEKNYPTVRSYWLKADPGESGRSAHTSESGRIYSVTLFKGSDNFGAFMANRVKINDAFATKEPTVNAEQMKNINGPITRSTWMRVDSLSGILPDYKMENFDFRKVQLMSVNADKIKEFQAEVRKLMQLDVTNGVKYNFIVFRCVDGYPTNTFLLILPDKSLMDYYKNREARKTKRNQAKSTYDPVNKSVADMSAIVRIDHLNRVKN